MIPLSTQNPEPKKHKRGPQGEIREAEPAHRKITKVTPR